MTVVTLIYYFFFILFDIVNIIFNDTILMGVSMITISKVEYTCVFILNANYFTHIYAHIYIGHAHKDTYLQKKKISTPLYRIYLINSKNSKLKNTMRNVIL